MLLADPALLLPTEKELGGSDLGTVWDSGSEKLGIFLCTPIPAKSRDQVLPLSHMGKAPSSWFSTSSNGMGQETKDNFALCPKYGSMTSDF